MTDAERIAQLERRVERLDKRTWFMVSLFVGSVWVGPIVVSFIR